MKTLKELSVEHFNETLKMISENKRLTKIAEITGDKNALLKLRFQIIGLKESLEYHRIKMNED